MVAGAARCAGGVRGGGTKTTVRAATVGSKLRHGGWVAARPARKRPLLRPTSGRNRAAACRGGPYRGGPVPRGGMKTTLGSSMKLQLRGGKRIGDQEFNSIRRVCQQVRQHLTLCRGEIA